jgi:hemerythrin superfamily protein
MPDPIEMLEQDHRRVEELYAQWQQSKDRTVAQQICLELTVHALVEEQSVYPVLADSVPQGEELEEEAEQEHAEAKELIAQIERAGFTGQQAEQLVDELMSAVNHHVEEEENEIFPKMRSALAADKLEALGATAAQIKQEQMAALGKSGTTLAAAASGGGTSGGSGTSKDQLVDLTREELYQMAQEREIEGRSDMNKDELIKALSKS